MTLAAFLVSPMIGALSDVLGRKYLLVACVFGAAAPYAVLGLGVSFEVHLIMLGACGALAASFPLAFAYIADRTAPSERAAAYGTTIGIAIGGSFCVAPALGSLLEYR